MARRTAEERVRPHQLKRRPGVFSGLLKCGVCGANYTVYNKGRLICSAHRESGDAVCANARTISREAVERRILGALKTRLLAPAVVSLYVRAFHQAWAEGLAERSGRRAPLEQRLGELTRSIGRGVDEILAGHASPALRERLAQLEKEKAALVDQLAQLEADSQPPVTFHPRLAEAYAARIGQLQESLAEVSANPGEAANHALISAARGFVDKIEVVPESTDYAAPVELKLHGRLALFLSETPGDVTRLVPLSGSKLVAGGGPKLRPTVVPDSDLVLNVRL
jgi:hypothetical protein